LLDLLAFGTSNILSPRSTPRWKFLDLASDILVGTGPYKYLYYIRDKEVKFERWDMYWAFPGYFEYVYFVINEDVTSRMNQGLSGTYDYIHYVPRDYIVNYLNNSQFHVEEVGEDLCYFYLEFYTGPRDYSGNFIETTNNKWQYQRLNSSWRRALTLALNYTNIWEVIQYGYGYPGCPAVPRSMPGYNSSLVGKMAHDFPFGGGYKGNIKKARDIMQSMGFGYDGPGLTNPWDTNYPGMDETKWTSIIFRELIYLHHFGSTTSNQLNFLMDNNWKLIGVNVNRYHCDWLGDCYWWEVMPWEFDVQFIGWCPDYLNPYNMINPLFNLQSQSCFSRINDTTPNGLTDMMNAALTEIDRDHQLEIYENIQSYIYDVTRPLTPASHVHIPIWVYLQYQVHKTMLKGIQYNPMLILECWNWYYEE
ncbi:MAG: ABC transporter substrate-binding protein, partial [Promethearchaeota archaeon]